MSFILDVDTQNAPEFKSLPSGTEAELRIVKAEIKNSKKGDPMLALRLDVPNEPYSKDINHFIMLPTAQDDDKVKAQKQNRLKEFKACFKLAPAGPISAEDMEGTKGWAILDEEESQEYGTQNRVKRFVVGQ
ncbi:MAG: hypothetical protein WC208_17095 [Gallionella sp.]|jgi:hypothetical protein